MLRTSLIVVVLFLFAGIPAGAQVATPDPASLLHAAAPLGLARVALPASEDDVAVVFAALPVTLDGEDQQDWVTAVDRIQVPWGAPDSTFGHPMVLGAISFEDGDFFPRDFTAGDYVAMTLATGEVESPTGGRDGDLVWVRAELSVGVAGERPGIPLASHTMHTLIWGDIDGGWVFTAIADTPERLDAIIVAFVDAAAATPAASTGGWSTGGCCASRADLR